LKLFLRWAKSALKLSGNKVSTYAAVKLDTAKSFNSNVN